MAKLTLTKDFLASVTCREGAAKADFFDTGCPGLMVEVRPTGRKTFYFRYTNERRQQRQHRIGDMRDINLQLARKLVKKLRTRVALGEDLVESKRALALVPKVSTFIEERYLPFVQGYKRSWKCDQGLLRKHISPVWGLRFMDQITKSDVVALMAKHRKTHAPGSCNRLLILLRYLFSLARKWETPGVKSNPTEGIQLLPENNKKERYLKQHEASALYAAVCRSENAMLQYIVPMLILTGARKREVLDAKWEDFDFDRRLWRIPTTKLGKPRHVPISDGVLALLGRVPRTAGISYVFANPATAKPYVTIFSSWSTARNLAGLSDVRLHDLRHSFASLLINNGRSLYEVQRILGHTQIKTTQRYAHLAPQTLLDASNVATLVIGSAMGVPADSAADLPAIGMV
jgi:integrase